MKIGAGHNFLDKLAYTVAQAGATLYAFIGVFTNGGHKTNNLPCKTNWLYYTDNKWINGSPLRDGVNCNG